MQFRHIVLHFEFYRLRWFCFVLNSSLLRLNNKYWSKIVTFTSGAKAKNSPTINRKVPLLFNRKDLEVAMSLEYVTGLMRRTYVTSSTKETTEKGVG